MLKKFTWIAAALLAMLAMAFFGCTDAGGLDDGSAPVAAEDFVIEGEDIILKACGQSSANVIIDGNKATLNGNNTGFYFDFPAEAAEYAEVQVFFKIVEIIAGRPGLLIKRSTQFNNPIGINSDEDPAYQLNDADTSGKEGFAIKPGFHFTVGMEFDTGLWKTNQFSNQMAFQNQVYNPEGNSNANWTVEVLKIVFPGGGEPVVPTLPPAYTGDASKVVLDKKGTATRLDDTVVDSDPSVLGDIGMTISATGVVTMTEGSLLKYKFPTSAIEGTGANAKTVAIDLEKDFDVIEFDFAFTNVVLGTKAAGGASDGHFKVEVFKYDNVGEYGVNPGAQYQRYGDFGAGTTGTATLETWGAFGSGGVTIRYNYGDRNGDGAVSMDVKLAKVTFKTAQRWKATFYDGSSAGVTYDVIEDNYLNKSAIPASVLAPTRAGWKFEGWNDQPDGSGDDYSGVYNATTNPISAITGDTALYAQWSVDPAVTKPTLPKTPINATPAATGTLFIAAGSYAEGTSGATYTYGGKTWWIVADGRTAACWDDPVAPFDAGTALADVRAVQDTYGSLASYTRIGIDFKTILEADPNVGTDWKYFDKVTITYDMMPISGADPLNARILNDANAATGGYAYPDLVAGDGKTLVLNVSDLLSGGIGITKNNVGAMLLRISKIEFSQDE